MSTTKKKHQTQATVIEERVREGEMTYYGDMGHCPICGKWCKNIRGYRNSQGLVLVLGVCKTHATVDLTNQSWSFDDFFRDDDDEIPIGQVTVEQS